jgi:alpha-1,6-mannosyltransferase
VLATTAVVIGAVRAGWAADVTTPAGPFGLWRPASGGRVWFAALAVTAVFVLSVAFLLLYRHAAANRIGMAAVARTAAVWCGPILLAPPLFSLDAYSYAAQGAMVLSHLDPYTDGPFRLGSGPILSAVAPIWRDTPAPYGPLSLVLLRVVAGVGDGDLPIMVYLLRLLALLAVVAAAVMTVRLADPSRRAAALALVLANPLVLLHLIGGVHLDALLAALAAATVLAVRRRWWATAALAAATAFAVKLPGLVLVGFVLLSAARASGFLERPTLRATLVAAAGGVGYTALVPNGWGWISALDVPGRVSHPYDPATMLGAVVHLVSKAAVPAIELPNAVQVGRHIGLVGGALAVLFLLWRAAGQASMVSSAALVGGALVVVALAAPTVHAWYVVWGLGLVAAGATGRARWWMVALGIALCFTAPPGPLGYRALGVALLISLLVAAMACVLAVARSWLPPPFWRRGGDVARVDPRGEAVA